MKILFINGSPRKNSNTALIIKLYSKLLQKQIDSKQIHTETISLTEMNIQSCKGCRICMEGPEEKCPCKDDVTAIKTKINQADLLVIGSPVYVEDVSGLLKSWIDRMAYNCHRPFLNGKKVILFTTSGANASNHALKTLQNAFAAWGATIIFTKNFSMGPKMEESIAEEKFTQLIQKQISKINIVKPLPLFSLLSFYVQKNYWIKKGLTSDSYDFQYWKNQGWLDKQAKYYYPVKINEIKYCFVKIFGKFVGVILY